MKTLSALFLLVILLVSCKNVEEPKISSVDQPEEKTYASYSSVGEEISGEGVISADEMGERYNSLAIGDTIPVKFEAKVNSVCKNKGCWMNLNLPGGEEAVVKFKDYAFFVPKDIEEKSVVVNGKAFLSVVSVEEQRHLAEDGGQSAEEIAAITEPKKTLSFLADGVLIEQ